MATANRASRVRALGAWKVLLLAPVLACSGPAALRAPARVAAATGFAGTPEPAGAPPVAVPDLSKELKAGIPGLPELEVDLERLRAQFDIPVEVNDEVIACIRRFQSPEVRPVVVRWLSRSQRYVPRFRAILRSQRVPEDLVYVAMIESGFVPHATSRARAVGIWQFIASTGHAYGLRSDSWVDERRDPEKAATAAARYLRALHERTGDWHLALAAYNAGPGRITRALRKGYASFWEMARSPGVLPRETRAYVPNVLAAAIVARYPEAFGFREDEMEPLPWTEYEVVRIPRATSLALLARAAGVSVVELRELNPELRRGATPPRPYALKIPRAAKAVFASRWPRLSRQALAARPLHRVQRGETLWSLSRRFRVSVDELARWNGIPPGARHRLRVGSLLAVREPAGGLGSWRPRETLR